MVAKIAGAKKLYLTHISSRYLAKDQKQMQQDAREVFVNTYLVNDYDEFDISLDK